MLITKYLYYILLGLYFLSMPLVAQENPTDSTKTKKGFLKRFFAKKDTISKQNLPKSSLVVEYTKALALYENGMPDSVLVILSKENLRAMNIGQANATEKAEIYRLKALASVLTDEMKDAQKNIKKLLALEPNYRPREDDLADFLWQKDQMTVVPKFAFGLKFGGNWTTPKVKNSYTIFDYSPQLLYEQEFQNTTNKPYDQIATNIKAVYAEPDSYSANWGGSFGVNLEYALTKRIRLTAEGIYERYSFKHNSNMLDANFVRLVNYGNFIAQFKYILPTDYIFKKLKWQPYVHYGVFSRILLQSIETEILTNTDRDFTPQTNGTATGILWGAGIRKAGKKSWISLEVSRKISPSNIANNTQRLFNNEASNYIFDFYSLNDDVSLNNWEIQLNLGLHLNYKVFKKRIFKK